VVETPSRVSVTSVLVPMNLVASFVPSVVPDEQFTHVSTPRDDCEVALLIRSRSAAAPFSTISPSGESLAVGGVPSSWLLQKLLDEVQNEIALGLMKPVAELIAETPVASTRLNAPTASRPNLYCLRLPRQRGLASPSGLNIPM